MSAFPQILLQNSTRSSDLIIIESAIDLVAETELDRRCTGAGFRSWQPSFRLGPA